MQKGQKADEFREVPETRLPQVLEFSERTSVDSNRKVLEKPGCINLSWLTWAAEWRITREAGDMPEDSHQAEQRRCGGW